MNAPVPKHVPIRWSSTAFSFRLLPVMVAIGESFPLPDERRHSQPFLRKRRSARLWVHQTVGQL